MCIYLYISVFVEAILAVFCVVTFRVPFCMSCCTYVDVFVSIRVGVAQSHFETNCVIL